MNTRKSYVKNCELESDLTDTTQVTFSFVNANWIFSDFGGTSNFSFLEHFRASTNE